MNISDTLITLEYEMKIAKALEDAYKIIDKENCIGNCIDGISIIEGAVEATIKAWLAAAENIEISKLQKENEALKKQNAKLKATNKKYCKDLIEYKMIENSMQNYDNDDCFDEEDFFYL